MNMTKEKFGASKGRGWVHVRWPLIVAGLLVCHVGAMVWAATIATRRGGAAVIPNYYEKSLHWDEERATAAKLNAVAVPNKPAETLNGEGGAEDGKN